MKRLIGYTLALFLLLGSGLAHAQSAVWTGDYFVVVGKNEKQQYAVTYGYHLKWHEIKAGPDFRGGTLADLATAPLAARDDARLPGRYELLAVGNLDGQAYVVTGYEYATEPRFLDGMEPLPSLTTATAAVWAGPHYVVLGRGMGGDGVLPTPRDMVAYGRPGDWQVVQLPFNDELRFTHLAAAPLARPYGDAATWKRPPIVPTYQLLAVGTYPDGSAFAMLGYEIDGVPTFTDQPLPIPEIVNPISVEWTGRDYLVVGDRGDGQFGVMYGLPGRWARAEDFTLDGGQFTGLAVAPHASILPDPQYELLSVGTLKKMAVSLAGRAVGGVPEFDRGCSLIPELRGTAQDPPSPGPAYVVGASEAGAVSAPYPNPFDARAVFSVTVGEDQRVRVAVYDALGREVAVLHDGVLAAGPAHTFAFEAGVLSSGRYLVRAQGERFVQTRPVVLAR